MNDKDYYKICNICDEILSDGDSNIEKYSIPYLHVINEHPITLKKYADIFHFRKSYFSSVFLFCAKSLFSLFKSLFIRRDCYASKDIPKNVEVLFISHYLNDLQKKNKDFYFGDMPEEIEKHGCQPVVLLHDQIGTCNSKTMVNWCSSLVPRVMFPKVMRPKDEVKIFWKALLQSWYFIKQAKLVKDDDKRNALKSAAKNTISMSSISGLRLYYQYKYFFSKTTPKTLITTYEGHAWERVAFFAARKVSPETKCIGYQHSILFQRQHSIKKARGKEYDPNIIFTSGAVGEQEMKSSVELKAIDIINIGTHKNVHGSLTAINKVNDIYNKSVLVIPDGIISECVVILEFVIEAAKLDLSVKYIFRLHPILTFDELVASNKAFKMLPINIEISSSTMEEDVKKCGWALYRGTSAIINAVAEGLRPIYLSLPLELDIDPLYDMKDWKKHVIYPTELLSLVKQDMDCKQLTNCAERNMAIEYCNNYFTPINKKRYVEFLACN